MKLLIELPNWLGDTVMAIPAIENLLCYLNDPKISLIGSFVSIEAFKNYREIEDAIIIKNKNFELYKAVKSLGNFDFYVSFRSSVGARIIKSFVSAKSKYQYDKKKFSHGHIVERYNDFINHSLGINTIPGKLKLKHKDKLFTDKKLLGINPGASYGSAKRWYPENFAKVAISLSSEYDIVIFGGPNEIDIASEIEQFLNQSKVFNFKNLAGKTNINELISEIANVDLFITGDSGPMHIAAALQVTTISLFGPTNEKETSQWMNKSSLIIKKNLDCQPCQERVCPLKHHKCMKQISPIEVVRKAKLINST